MKMMTMVMILLVKNTHVCDWRQSGALEQSSPRSFPNGSPYQLTPTLTLSRSHPLSVTVGAVTLGQWLQVLLLLCGQSLALGCGDISVR